MRKNFGVKKTEKLCKKNSPVSIVSGMFGNGSFDLVPKIILEKAPISHLKPIGSDNVKNQLEVTVIKTSTPFF